MSNNDFDSAVESYQQALDAFLKGDAGPVSEHFSRRDDVTLANPLGPPRVGRADVETAIRQASAHFEDGFMRFEEISRYATDDLAADTFESDEELEEFLAFNYAERHRDVA